MRKASILIIGATVSSLLPLSGCGSAPASFPVSIQSFAEGAAAACARIVKGSKSPTDRELCDSYWDIRGLAGLESQINAASHLQIRVIPLPCAVDGPGCPWADRWHEILAGLGKTWGDPNPQPNLPLPSEIIAPAVQLRKAIGLRNGLMRDVEDLDRQIDTLRAAVGDSVAGSPMR